jgi:pSer/pThr/pTyr-binding forkhead associated (FHA) protein
MKLVIEDEEGRRREVPLDRDEITIGRREDNVVHLPERNVSRLHARLLRRNGEVLLEDLRSANGTRVNGVRILEGTVPLHSGDVVGIGDYGVALRPDDAPLDAPVSPDPMEETAPAIRTDVLADTAPHPLVQAEPTPPTEPPPARHGRRLTVGMVVVGAVLGLAVAFLLRALSAEERPRQVVPPPTPIEPPPIELSPPTLAQRPSTPTEWLATARAAAAGREFDRAVRLLGSVHDPVYQGEVQSLRKTWKAEAAVGRTVQAARMELERGRPTVAQRKVDSIRATRAWAPEVAVLRADIAAALKAPKKGRNRPSGSENAEQLYREGKALYDAGDAREATAKFERCLGLDARQPRCHLMLASASVRTGDTARAEVHYRRFLELAAPDDPAVPRVKKFLEDSDAQKKARDASASPQR